MTIFFIYLAIILQLAICTLLVIKMERFRRKIIDFKLKILTNYRDITDEIRFIGDEIQIKLLQFEEKFVPKEMNEDDFVKMSDELIDDIFSSFSSPVWFKKKFIGWIVFYRLWKYRRSLGLTFGKSLKEVGLF